MTQNNTDTDDPLEELFIDAEEQREKYNEARNRLQRVREQLRELVGELEADDAVDAEAADRIRGFIENGQYEKARDAIRNARENSLEFDDEEKDIFAQNFAASWEEMTETAEAVATALLAFEDTVDREDMVAYLFGKHSGMRKGDIRAVFDAFDSVPSNGLSTRQMARVLASFNHDLNIEPTVDVLEAIKKESQR